MWNISIRRREPNRVVMLPRQATMQIYRSRRKSELQELKTELLLSFVPDLIDLGNQCVTNCKMTEQNYEKRKIY